MLLPPVTRPSSLKDDVLTRHLDQVVTALKAVLAFLAPFAAPDPWHYVTFLNGWANYGVAPDDRPAGYTKDALGRVQFRGVVANAATTILPIFVLPPAYRPSVDTWFIVAANGDVGQIRVGVEGNVEMRAGKSANPCSKVHLNGIFFDVRA